MPDPWRPATRAEIGRHYREGFPDAIDHQLAHVAPPGPKEWGLSFREPHPVCGDDIPDRDFLRRPTWETTTGGTRRTPNLSTWDDLWRSSRPGPQRPAPGSDHALADPAVLDGGDPVPEAVYYALDR